jgi:hypothetical protein
MMDLTVNVDAIEASFDRIAKEILLQKALVVNGKIIRFTEIEFYYFHETHHPDNYTHKHDREAGEWRFHNQGIDITFESTQVSDGGILIRGILVDGKYVNGPRKIWTSIFKTFGKVSEPTSFVLDTVETRNVEIIKTFRILSNKIGYPEYHKKHYRYLVDLDDLDILHSDKNAIEQDHEILNASS